MDSEKIKSMSIAGKILGEVLDAILEAAKPGVSENDLDMLAQDLILKKGGKPGFKRVPGYKNTICISVNDVVVHGIPTSRILKEGDVVGIDCGVFLNGYHTDMAETIKVQSSDDKIDRFLKIGRRALFEGIKQAKVGNRVGHISRAIQDTVEGAGYSVVRSLIGHGVGKKLHEPPEVPGYLSTTIDKTPELSEGMTLAVEVIYNMGKPEVMYGDDDWTISTEDKSLSGLFERTILITDSGHKLLTRLKDDQL